MEIVFVSGIFPPDIGGPARYVPMMAESLMRRGHALRVVVLAEPLADAADSEGAHPYPVTRVQRRQWKPMRLLRTVLAIVKAARGADFIFANSLHLESLLAAGWSRKKLVLKIVGDQAWERARNHGWFHGTLEEYQDAKKPPLFKILNRLRAWPARSAQSIIVPSHYLKKIVAGWGVDARRIEVIYNAAEPFPGFAGSQAEIAKPSRPFRICAICRLVSWKGVDGIVRAMARMESVTLCIVGEGPERSRLENLARELQVSDRIQFAGMLGRSGVAAQLQASDCFVLNSTYEGLPHVVLEAMSMGIPVIATRVGGTPELVLDRETGILIPPGDDEALSRAVQEIAQDAEWAGRMAIKAKHRVQREFSVESMIRATESVLEFGVGNKP